MITTGITDDELKQAKSGYIQYRETGRADDAQLASTLDNYLYINRMMTWDQDIDDKLQKITVAQVNGVMKKLLAPNKISFVKAGDFK